MSRIRWHGSLRPAPAATGPGRLLAVIGLVQAAFLVGTTFVGLFILTTFSGPDLVFYAMTQFAATWAAFHAAPFLMRVIDPVRAVRLGLFFSGLLYAGLAVLPAVPFAFIPALAGFTGLGHGLYWYGINLLIYDLVPAAGRVRFFSRFNMIMYAVSILGPLAGGLAAAIPRLGSLTGYQLLFAGVVLLFGTGIAASLPLRDRRRLRPASQRKAFALPVLNPRWRLVALSLFATSVYQGITTVAPAILTSRARAGPLTLGAYVSLASLSGMTGAFLAGRLEAPGRWWANALGGVTGLSASVLILLGPYGVPQVLGFAAASALCQPFYLVPVSTQTAGVMDRDPGIESERVNYILSREDAINAGRILGLSLILVTGVLAPGHTAFGRVLLLGTLPLYVLPLTLFRLRDPAP